MLLAFLINAVFYNLNCNLHSLKVGDLWFFSPLLKGLLQHESLCLLLIIWAWAASLGQPFTTSDLSCVSSMYNSELGFLSESSSALTGSVIPYKHQVSMIVFSDSVFVFSPPKLLQESCFHATITQVTLIWTGIQGFIAWILLRDSFVSWVTVTSLQYFCFVSLNHVIYKYRNPLLCSFLWHKMLFETELCVLPLEILTFSHTCL